MELPKGSERVNVETLGPRFQGGLKEPPSDRNYNRSFVFIHWVVRSGDRPQ